MDKDVDDKVRQPKRKPRNQSEWKREKRKRSIIAGKQHLSVKGQLVSSKQIGADCKCKLKCFEKVGERTRQMLFDGFYSLVSYDEQNAYLFGLIRKHDVKRKKNPSSHRRTCSYKYYVRNHGKEIQVCKLAFAHIHSISFRKIRTLSEKLDQNVLFPRDNRGKHNNRPKKISQEKKNLIKNHIFTIIKSNDLKNYMKEDKNHQLMAELNVAKLYANFLTVHEAEAIDSTTGFQLRDYNPRVKSWLYRKVFHEEVKLRDFQTIRKRLEALNNARDDCGGMPTIDGDAPLKRSRRKGLARKIETMVSLPVALPDMHYHYNNAPPLIPVAATSYQPDHSLQEYTHNHNRLMPSFEHRLNYQDHSSSQHLDVNEMTQAFMYSPNC